MPYNKYIVKHVSLHKFRKCGMLLKLHIILHLDVMNKYRKFLLSVNKTFNKLNRDAFLYNNKIHYYNLSKYYY